MPDALVVGGDGFVVPAHGLEHVTETEQRADVRRLDCQAFLVRLDGLVRERGGRERGAAQEKCLRVAGIKLEHAVEALECLGIAVLLLAQRPRSMIAIRKSGAIEIARSSSASASSYRCALTPIAASRRRASTLRGR
jgi:hypothetical protein